MGRNVSKLLPMPEEGWRKWIWNHATWETIIALGAAGAGGSSAWLCFVSDPPQKLVGLLMAFSTVLSVVGAIVSAALKSNDRSPPIEKFHPFEAIMYELHAVLVHACNGQTENHGLRVALFSVSGNEVIQRTHYVGETRKHGRGQRFSTALGIVGKAARRESDDALVDSVTQSVDRIKHLCDQYGYTPAQAENLRKTSMSWVAVPIRKEGKAVAVIFADSNRRQFFTNLRVEVLNSTVIAIGHYMEAVDSVTPTSGSGPK